MHGRSNYDCFGADVLQNFDDDVSSDVQMHSWQFFFSIRPVKSVFLVSAVVAQDDVITPDLSEIPWLFSAVYLWDFTQEKYQEVARKLSK